MSVGLVGVFDARAGDDALRCVVDRMGAAVATAPGWQTAGGARTDAAHCRVLQSGDPAVALDRDVWLVFAGELYNRAELEQRLEAAGEPVAGRNAAALCLALLRREGDSFVGLLNGQFNIATYRAAAARLSLATDRVGYRPLYVAQRGSRVLFATALKAILAALEVAPGIDGIGLLQTMRGGWPLGHRTWLDGIAVADPGSWLHVDSGGCRQERYFRLQFAAGGFRNITEYAEGLAATLRRAVHRATDDGRRFAVPLSGGLDSRAILLATAADRRPAMTYTFGRDWSFDVLYARRLADVAHAPHRHFAYEPGYLGRVLDDVVRRTEGIIGFANATFTSFYFHDRIAEDAGVLLYGHGGDCLTGAHLRPSMLATPSREGLIARTFRLYQVAPEPMLKQVFHDSFYRRYADQLFDALRDTFKGIEGERIADIADVWDVENRQRRGTFSSCAVDRDRFEVRAPFLDRDVIDYLRRAPLRWRVLQLGYKRMLVKVLGAGAVPWSYTGKRLQSTFLGDFMQQGWNYGERRLLSAPTDPRQFRDLTHDTRSDASLRRVLEDFVRHPEFPGDIFDRTGIEDIVQRHWTRQADLTHLVIMLATFAAAWQLFLYQAKPPQPQLASSG